MCVLCEDCKFANWDAELFRDREEGHWEGMHYIPPYSEQLDFYCSKHEQFYMEQDAPDCQDGEFGENNLHEACKEHERQIKAFKEELLIKKAKKCPYYGCAGTRICTYHSWTTHCPFPDCDKKNLWTGLSAYDANESEKERTA